MSFSALFLMQRTDWRVKITRDRPKTQKYDYRNKPLFTRCIHYLQGDRDLEAQFSRLNFFFFPLVYAWWPGDECYRVALTCMILPSFKWRAEVVTGIPAPDKSCFQTVFSLSHLFTSISLLFLDPECLSL